VYLEKDEPHGIVVDLFEAMRPLLPEGSQIRAMDWKRAQVLVSSDQADALVQINQTPAREKLYDFSQPLLESRFVIFVKSTTLGVSSVRDLDGKRVGVEEAGLPRQILTERGTTNLVFIPDFPAAFRQVVEGTLDAVVVDERVGEYVLATGKIGGVKSTGLPVAISFSSIAVRKGNQRLLDQINRALSAIRQNGTYQKVLDNWNPTEVIYETRAQIEGQQYLRLAFVLGIGLILAVGWAMTIYWSLKKARRAETSLRADIQERERLEKSLASSEKQLNGILQHSQDAIGVHHDGIWEIANPAAVRLFGVSSANELVGTPIADVLAPEERPRILEIIRARGTDEQAPDHYLTVGLRRDGTTFEMEVSRSEYELEGRALVLVLLRDVSEQARRERELRESEEVHRLVVTASPDPVILHQQGRIFYVNPAAVRLFGATSADALLGMPIVDRVHPEALGRLSSRFAQVAPGQLIEAEDGKLLRLDGTPIDTEVRGGGLLLSGSPAMLLLVRELTERNRAKARQKALLRRYETILNASRDGIHILKPDGSVLDVNPAFCTMLGYPREELLGLNVGDWDHQWSAEDLEARIRALIDRPGTFETKHRRKDGTLLDVEISGVGIELEGVRYLYASARDITERKYLDQKVQREQRLESLGVLAGGIAHDFNNILAGLNGQVELALLCAQNANTQGAIDRLAKIPAVVERGRALSRRLLTFSRGGSPVRAAVFLGRHLREWVDFALVGSDLHSVVEIPPDLWGCQGDVNQLGQVVSNLLINARQASPEGGTIQVRATNLFDSAPLVCVDVTDGGPGIDPAHVDRIFDPFFTTKAGGTGLGLSVAFSIVKQHGGTLAVATGPGTGTTFSLRIPADPTLRDPIKPQPELPTRLSGTAVVMDDEDLIGEAVGQTLRDLGYEVLLAQDGRDVLKIRDEQAERGRPVSLFVLDGLIPNGMGGQETLRQLRLRQDQTPVILMSGYFDIQDLASAPHENRVLRLAKPFLKTELTGAVGTLLERPSP